MAPRWRIERPDMRDGTVQERKARVAHPSTLLLHRQTLG
jgi:hypothetical protein